MFPKERRGNPPSSTDYHNVAVQRQALFPLLHVTFQLLPGSSCNLPKSLRSTCLTATEPSSLLRSDLGFRTERRGSEIRPPGAGPPPSEIPAPGTCTGRLRPPPRGPCPRARAARPHIHTHRSTYRPLRGDVGREPQAARRACAGLLARPSAPRGLSPRPPVGEAADPRGSEGRARSQARAGEPGPSLLHMEPGPGDGRAALRGRRESLSAPRCFSLARPRGPREAGQERRKPRTGRRQRPEKGQEWRLLG